MISKSRSDDASNSTKATRGRVRTPKVPRRRDETETWFKKDFARRDLASDESRRLAFTHD
jgi:hypothetical protein